MRTRIRIIAVLAAALAVASCSTERLDLTLGVGASPNPVAGVPGADGRVWEWQVTITNPEPVGVFLEYFHTAVAKSDTGFEQMLLVEKLDPALGRRIPAGGAVSFVAARRSLGAFSQATERRIYHAIGDDGRYYSGEMFIRLE